MIALLQRVSKAAVTRGDERRDSGPGLAVLLGVGRGDTDADAAKLAARTATLRIFDDADGKLNRSLLDTGGAALVVPQFTLCADTRKGRRPSYDAAAAPEPGETLYRRYVAALRDQGVAVTEGWFRATMQVEIHNDGPVTILLRTETTNEHQVARINDEQSQELIIHKDLSYQLVGLAMQVHTELGGGFLEKVYENALMKLLAERGIPARQQEAMTVRYHGEGVGEYAADILVDQQIILELKTAATITDVHRAQALNYLKATGLHLAIILNFGKDKLTFQRMVR